jgi:hypothetical protein
MLLDNNNEKREHILKNKRKVGVGVLSPLHSFIVLCCCVLNQFLFSLILFERLTSNLIFDRSCMFMCCVAVLLFLKLVLPALAST